MRENRSINYEEANELITKHASMIANDFDGLDPIEAIIILNRTVASVMSMFIQPTDEAVEVISKQFSVDLKKNMKTVVENMLQYAAEQEKH